VWAACDLHDDRKPLANQIIGAATSKTVATTRRYRDLLDNKDIDCVVVPSPITGTSKYRGRL